MTKQEVKNYFNSWGKDAGMFIEMLQEKTTFAKVNHKSIMAGGKVRTGKELEEMLVIADDMFCAGELN